MSITNFEHITHDLNEYELSLVPNIVKKLTEKIGKENAVTNKQICAAHKAFGKKLEGPRLRKIINFIRVNNLVYNLVATSNGYYRAQDHNEALEYIRSLDERANEIIRVRDAMQYQYDMTVRAGSRDLKQSIDE
jgi:hypothetical protein